jgi:hypothetical protein
MVFQRSVAEPRLYGETWVTPFGLAGRIVSAVVWPFRYVRPLKLDWPFT